MAVYNNKFYRDYYNKLLSCYFLEYQQVNGWAYAYKSIPEDMKKLIESENISKKTCKMKANI